MPQRPKYNAKKIEIDGIKFDSKIEGDYYLYLKGLGKDFKIHPTYLLQEKFKHNEKRVQPICYEADFKYDNIVVDIKGLPTEVAKLKRKMFIFRYPELELKRLVKYQNNRVDYFENEKRKKDLKKSKKTV